MMDKVLAVIPARGGSKRLPDKNMKALAGKPLLGWTIDHALAAGFSTGRIIVSSDYEPALEYAKFRDVEALRRPDELAQGLTPPIWNVRHAFKWYREQYGEERVIDYVVLLQPTSPFRSPEDIISAVHSCERTGADSVVTLTVPKQELWHLGHAGRMRLLSQTELGAVFTPNGAVYVITTDHLDAGGDWWDGIITGHLMPADRSVDIDYHHDFDAAEQMMRAAQVAGAA